MISDYSRDFSKPLCLDGFEEDLAESIVEVHDRIVSKRGYNPMINKEERDEMVGRVISAISAVFTTFYGVDPKDRYHDVFLQIAVFASHLSKDHIFPDGNKRTAVISSLGLLYYAGFTLDVEDGSEPERNALYRWIQGIVTDKESIDDLAGFLRECKKRI